MLNKTVLLVDYEPKGLASMKSYLEGLGLVVDTATDGTMALTRFFDKRPDLVVMSPMLPKIHGFDVCRQITQSPQGKDVPVIIVTAVYKGSKYRTEAIHSCGARAYFEKPYAEEELTDTIFKLLGVAREAPKPVPAPTRAKSLDDILPDLKADRTMPFIKKSDVLASLHAEKQKAAVPPPPAPVPAAPPKPAAPPEQKRPVEEKFVTSEDIFGEVIDSVEERGPAAPSKAPVSVPTVVLQRVQTPAPPKVEKPAPPVEAEPIRPAALPPPPPPPPPQPRAESANARFEAIEDLARLDQTIKKSSPVAATQRKADSDVERKLEETLSGLTLEFGRPRPPKSAAPPKVELPQPPRPEPPIVAKVEVSLPKAQPPAQPEVEPTAPPVISKIEAPLPAPQPPVVAKVEVPLPKPEMPAPKIEPTKPIAAQVEPVPPKPEPPMRETPKPEPVRFEAPKAEAPAAVIEPPKREPVRIETPPPSPSSPSPSKVEPPRVEIAKPAPPPPPPPARIEPKPRQEPSRQDRPTGPVPFGDYVLLEKIATGGMAELFKAKRSGPEGFEKILAIKRILPHLSDNEEFVTMFIDEAKVAAQLNHPNIVHIYDLGKLEDSYFIAMEFVMGKDLRAIIKDLDRRNQTLPYELAAYIGIKVCESLDYAHRKLDYNQKPLNIVHRDVSPQNILISYEGDVKLVDFGVAKAASKAHHTTHGALKGKILYMSPEQAWGKSIDMRSDLFSLGSVLFETATGRKLFLGDSEMSTLEAVRNGKLMSPSSIKADFPAAFEAVILKALKAKTDERYSSAAEMQKALENYLDTMHVRPSAGTLSEHMHAMYSAEMKAKGIQLEPRKPAAPPRPVEPAVRVEKPIEKPEVKVPPPKVIAPTEKPMPSVPVPAARAPSGPRAEPELAFKSVLDTAVHTGYQRVRNRRLGIIAAIAAVAIVVVGAILFFGRSKAPAPAPSNVQTPSTPTPGPTTPTPSPTTPGPTTAPANPAPDQKAADKQKEEELKKKQEEERQRKLKEQQQKDEDARKVADAQAEEQRKAEEVAKAAAAEEQRKKDEEAAKAASAAAEADRLRKEEDARRLAQQQQAQVNEGDLIAINQVDVRPIATNKIAPVYPEAAKRANAPQKYTVKLSILVTETGQVGQINVLSGGGGAVGILNEAAKSAVSRWKFQPATKSGKKVKVWLPVDIPFVR